MTGVYRIWKLAPSHLTYVDIRLGELRKNAHPCPSTAHGSAGRRRSRVWDRFLVVFVGIHFSSLNNR